MGSSRSGYLAASLAAVAGIGLLSGGPAAADWLVTRDGSRVETRGGWEVKGKLVVFHTTNGTFSSMRLDALDLEASAALTDATAAARRARSNRPGPLAPAAPKAKFILTDDDVGHVDPATPTTAGEALSESGEQASPGGGVTTDNPLEVVSWDASVGANADGVAISGVIGNPSDFHAANVAVTVTVLDAEGEVVGERLASMDVNALSPGDQRPFRVVFPGLYSVDSARFEVTSFNAVIANEEEDRGDDNAPAY